MFLETKKIKVFKKKKLSSSQDSWISNLIYNPLGSKLLNPIKLPFSLTALNNPNYRPIQGA